MEIETLQNIVLIGMGVIIFLMYITAKAWDAYVDDLEAKARKK